MIFYLFIKVKKRGCTSACIYMGTQSQPNYRIARWIFTKLGRDKALMTYIFLLTFWSNPPRGWYPGQGHNRSMRDPSPKDFFFRVVRLQQQTECIAMISKHLGRCVVIFGSIVRSSV